MDSRVQNIEKRIENLYEELRKYENNVNVKLTSLEEFRTMYARTDEQVLHLTKQLENLFYMLGKNEQKLDLIILQKDNSASVRNHFEVDDQSRKDRNRKLNEAYQHLNQNMGSDLPTFTGVKNNFNMNLENLDTVDRKFDFNNALTKCFDCTPTYVNNNPIN